MDLNEPIKSSSFVREIPFHASANAGELGSDLDSDEESCETNKFQRVYQQRSLSRLYMLIRLESLKLRLQGVTDISLYSSMIFPGGK